MVYTNYPGSISLGIYDAIAAAPGPFRIGWQFLFAFVVLFLSLVTFIKIQYPERINNLRRFKWVFSPTAFILVLCTGLFLLRLPNMILPRQSVDEDQWIVAGISYLHGAVLWQGITGNTSGPLVFSLPLMMVPIDGLNYTTIRLFGMLLCIIPAIYMIWRTLKLLYGDIAAQISVISLFIFFVTINEQELIVYNSEHVPMLLTSIALFLFFSIAYAAGYSVRVIAFLGFVLGLMPYSKLQVMPIGICIGLLGIFELATQKELPVSKRARHILILIAFALIPSMVVGIYLTVHHAWGDFWSGYLLNNVQYAMHNGANAQTFQVLTRTQKMTIVPWLLLKNHYLTKFVLSQICIVLIIGAFQFRSLRSKSFFNDKLLWYAILIACAAYIAVSAPGNRFTHYIYLFIFPFILLTGILIGKLLSIHKAPSVYKIGIFLPCLIYIFLVLWKSPTTEGYDFVVSKQTLAMTDASKMIRKYAHPGEWMSVWGWGVNGFVEADLVMANKSNSPFWDMFTGDNPALFDEYMGEMRAKKPVVFLDAMLVTSSPIEKFRYENYPALHTYITENYKKVGEYDGKRIFIRNDREREVDSLSIHP
jgi:hypothetical protein